MLTNLAEPSAEPDVLNLIKAILHVQGNFGVFLEMVQPAKWDFLCRSLYCDLLGVFRMSLLVPGVTKALKLK